MRFPIRKTVVVNGEDREMILEEGTTVRCVRCGSVFRADRETAITLRTAEDEWPCLRCPECRRIADAFYYLLEPPRPKRPRTPEMVRVPWKTPEDW